GLGNFGVARELGPLPFHPIGARKPRPTGGSTTHTGRDRDDQIAFLCSNISASRAPFDGYREPRCVGRLKVEASHVASLSRVQVFPRILGGFEQAEDKIRTHSRAPVQCETCNSARRPRPRGGNCPARCPCGAEIAAALPLSGARSQSLIIPSRHHWEEFISAQPESRTPLIRPLAWLSARRLTNVLWSDRSVRAQLLIVFILIDVIAGLVA